MNLLIALPSQGVIGGMELFAIAVADAMRGQPDLEVRLVFKIVAGFDIQPALRARCADLGLDAYFCERGSRALLGHLRWADLVHANNCSPDILLVAKVLGKALVVTVHNWRRAGGGLRQRLWKLGHDLADARTYNSRFVMDTWQAARPLPRSRVIPAVTHFGGQRVASESRRGFFFLGRWIEGKGIAEMIEAYAMADLDRAAWPLTLAGDGPLRPALTQRIAALGVPGITVTGLIAESDKYARLASAKWLVCPPNTREDMGLTPIEARYLGLPSIVTVDGGVPEAAGPWALFCPPGNVAALAHTLELAASLPESVYQLRAAGAERSLDGYLQPLSVYADIYAEVMGSRLT